MQWNILKVSQKTEVVLCNLWMPDVIVSHIANLSAENEVVQGICNISLSTSVSAINVPLYQQYIPTKKDNIFSSQTSTFSIKW